MFYLLAFLALLVIIYLVKYGVGDLRSLINLFSSFLTSNIGRGLFAVLSLECILVIIIYAFYLYNYALSFNIDLDFYFQFLVLFWFASLVLGYIVVFLLFLIFDLFYKITHKFDYVFLSALFRLVGFVSNAQGSNKKHHLLGINHYLDKKKLTPNLREMLLDEYNKGKEENFDLSQTCSQLNDLIGGNFKNKKRIIKFILLIVLENNKLKDEEKIRVLNIAYNFDIDRHSVDTLISKTIFECVHNEKVGEFVDDKNDNEDDEVLRPNMPEEVIKAFKFLKLDKNLSAPQIKREYISLMKKYHPDKIAAQGIVGEQYDIEVRYGVRVQEAYEVIRAYLQSRGEI